MSKAQEEGLDQDKVRELLSGFTDEKGNIDWEGALVKAQEIGPRRGKDQESRHVT
jgi:hypothetical protein